MASPYGDVNLFDTSSGSIHFFHMIQIADVRGHCQIKRVNIGSPAKVRE